MIREKRDLEKRIDSRNEIKYRSYSGDKKNTDLSNAPPDVHYLLKRTKEDARYISQLENEMTQLREENEKMHDKIMIWEVEKISSEKISSSKDLKNPFHRKNSSKGLIKPPKMK